jgi:fucose 4-O-acetylase-like acetyltransferase
MSVRIPSRSASRPGQARVAAGHGERLLFIDNLRWTMILLVISMHSADTYSPFGNWYYTDRRPLSRAALLGFAAWQMYLQSFFMGLLFFVAGFFVPASFERKGPARFLRDRGYRLGLPVLFYMLVLGPITEYFFSHSWNSTEPTSFLHEWIKHIRNGEFLGENGPLWFCLALLIFSAVYTIWRAWRSNPPPFPLEEHAHDTPLLVGFALTLAAFTFATRLVLPSGTSLLNMHLSDFPQYILLFAAGITMARTRWLRTIPLGSGLFSLLAALTIGLAAWFCLLQSGGAFAGNGRAFSGGWHWQNAAFALWEAASCTATSYGLLAVFHHKFGGQGGLARFLSANAFSVYVFHPPIVIACARLLHPLEWPSPLMFLMLTTLSAVASFVLSALVFRRIPFLRKIL